jgi:hypothetical protein
MKNTKVAQVNAEFECGSEYHIFSVWGGDLFKIWVAQVFDYCGTRGKLKRKRLDISNICFDLLLGFITLRACVCTLCALRRGEARRARRASARARAWGAIQHILRIWARFTA